MKTQIQTHVSKRIKISKNRYALRTCGQPGETPTQGVY